MAKIVNALVQRDQTAKACKELFTGEQPVFAALLSYCMHVNILGSEPKILIMRRDVFKCETMETKQHVW